MRFGSLWADPYAAHYLVQYWTGTDPMHEATKGDWVTFPGGEIRDGKDGDATLQLSPHADARCASCASG